MNIIVDGREISVRADETLLKGLLGNGFDVPNMCYLPELEPYGGCGLCLVEIEGMPRPQRACVILPQEGMKVATTSDRIERSRQASLAMLLSDHRGDCRPPCRQACPSNQDCQGYAGLIAQGRFDEAMRLIMEDNPLPASIGRVCPHPCEEACRREKMEGPLSLMRLKRFAAETAGASFAPEMKEATGKAVAVVGAGPAGLSAAYYLARQGHQVDVYDQMPAPGGMLRYGIPAYRLEKDVIDREVARIEKMSVRFHYNEKLGESITLEALQTKFDAVFVAVGAWESASLGCENDNLPGVLGGIDFLEAAAQDNAPAIGDKVAVVGGGNTAMDAVRTAVRLGAKEVTLVYRRTRAEMPAEKLEIDEAEEEGVSFLFLVAPEAVIAEDGRAVGLKLSQMRLGEPDASGRRRPEPTGEVIERRFDTIIAAIGQKVRPDGIGALEKHRWRTIKVNPATYETNLPGVFAGGDAVNDGPGIAIAAIAHGKNAARVIGSYLAGNMQPIVKPFLVEKKDVTADDLPEMPEVQRVPLNAAAPEKRVQHFGEFVDTLSVEDAVREAGRCLECGCCDLYDCRLLPLLQKYRAAELGDLGTPRKKKQDNSHPMIWRDESKCVLCGLCVRVCDKIVGATALGFESRGFETTAAPAFQWPLAESDCVSCGLCAAVCPTGALQDRRPFEKTPPLPIEEEDIVCARCDRGCPFTLHRYGGKVLKAIPKERGNSCSIGRYGPVVDQLGEMTPEQREAVDKALHGDLKLYQGK